MLQGLDKDGQPLAGEVVDGKRQCQYKFSAVYSADPEHENKVFTDYTPSLNIDMVVTNAAVDFTLGQEYYIDFSRASRTPKYAPPKRSCKHTGRGITVLGECEECDEYRAGRRAD